MKNLVLNNFGMSEMDRRMQKVLEKDFLENREIWLHFETSFHPANKVNSTKRFLALETGDNIICETVFEDYQQLELMALLLMQSDIKEGINIYIIHPDLREAIKEYFDQDESDITPTNKIYNSSEERRKYKESMNTIVKGTFVKHNIYDVKAWGSLNYTKLTLQDF